MRVSWVRRAERLLGAALAKGRFDYWTGLPFEAVVELERLGSAYGGWVVPVQLFDESSICYCAGVGLDASFDLALAGRAGCIVHAFDPTPRAAAYAEQVAAKEPRFRFSPVGLWDEDTSMRFFAPADPSHVSHSIVNLQKTETFFEADCRSVRTLMRERGHDRIDLLKMDIEGAEYRVLDALLAEGILPGVLCIEFDERHHPIDAGYRKRMRQRIDALRGAGYRLVHVDRAGNYTLVHGPWLDARRARA